MFFSHLPSPFSLLHCTSVRIVKPQVTLRLGSNLRHSHIQEGNDVYFECLIRSSPLSYEVRWNFEGREVQTNTSAGVIVSNQSLVLQKVRRQQRGKYTCSATNSEGDGESNIVHLRIQFSPICKPGWYSFFFSLLFFPKIVAYLFIFFFFDRSI